jgi:hypothetical protein
MLRLDEQPSWFERLRASFLLTRALPAAALAIAFALVFTRLTSIRHREAFELRDYELAANMELIEDYEVLGLESPEDVELVQHLHEFEEPR